MKRAHTVPVAAFAQSAVEPGFMRLSPDRRNVLRSPKHEAKPEPEPKLKPNLDSSSDGEDDDV